MAFSGSLGLSVNAGGATGGTVGGVTVGHRQTDRRQRRDLHVTGQRRMTSKLRLIGCVFIHNVGWIYEQLELDVVRVAQYEDGAARDRVGRRDRGMDDRPRLPGASPRHPIRHGQPR
jgi:hypothetical protein